MGMYYFCFHYHSLMCAVLAVQVLVSSLTIFNTSETFNSFRIFNFGFSLGHLRHYVLGQYIRDSDRGPSNKYYMTSLLC